MPETLDSRLHQTINFETTSWMIVRNDALDGGLAKNGKLVQVIRAYLDIRDKAANVRMISA
jgi:hypothetical protein